MLHSMDYFKLNSSLMLHLVREWKNERSRIIIEPIKDAAKELEEKMEGFNQATVITSLCGAAYGAIALGAMGTMVLVPGTLLPVLAEVSLGYGGASGVLTTAALGGAVVTSQLIVNKVEQLREADEELLTTLLERLRTTGFSSREHNTLESGTSSMAAFFARSGIVAVPMTTVAFGAAAISMRSLTQGLLCGGSGLSLALNGYSFWRSLSKYEKGRNSETSHNLMKYANALEEDSEALLEDLEHSLMEKYMDERLSVIEDVFVRPLKKRSCSRLPK